MTCPSCGQRKGRRTCPALGATICTVCCGTKRLVEINCPGTCPHLAAAREHPAAVVRRQQERDVAILMPTLKHLTERQHQLVFLFQTVIARHTPEGFGKLNDDDAAEAAAAAAATLETAARGVIYEHSAQSLVAQRLAKELMGVLEEIRQQGTTVYDREAAIVLRAIEQGARETRKATGGDAASYLVLISRLLQVTQGAPTGAGDASQPARPAAGTIVLP